MYVAVKGGPLYPSDDDLDAGWYVGGAYGQYMNRFLAFEIESGYGQADLDVLVVRRDRDPQFDEARGRITDVLLHDRRNRRTLEGNITGKHLV